LSQNYLVLVFTQLQMLNLMLVVCKVYLMH